MSVLSTSNLGESGRTGRPGMSEERRAWGPAGWRALLAGVALGLIACPAPHVPEPSPAPPPPPPVKVAPPPPAPHPSSPRPQDIVINQADLFGQFEGRQGAIVTIRALLVMTPNHPQVGHKGTLACAPTGGGSDDDWLTIADVEVKRPLDDQSRIQVRLVAGDKPLLLPGPKKPTPLPRNMRLRLRWEY